LFFAVFFAFFLVLVEPNFVCSIDRGEASWLGERRARARSLDCRRAGCQRAVCSVQPCRAPSKWKGRAHSARPPPRVWHVRAARSPNAHWVRAGGPPARPCTWRLTGCLLECGRRSAIMGARRGINGAACHWGRAAAPNCGPGRRSAGRRAAETVCCRQDRPGRQQAARALVCRLGGPCGPPGGRRLAVWLRLRRRRRRRGSAGRPAAGEAAPEQVCSPAAPSSSGPHSASQAKVWDSLSSG